MPYKFREDLAIADVAFEASGNTLEELFDSAAKAVENTMVHDLDSVRPQKSLKIAVKARNEEHLLHSFLEELVFQKDAKLLLFSSFAIKIKKEKNGFSLSCTAKGEKLDMQKHDLLVDVKAVTWHNFKLEKKAGKWQCLVILDV